MCVYLCDLFNHLLHTKIRSYKKALLFVIGVVVLVRGWQFGGKPSKRKHWRVIDLLGGWSRKEISLKRIVG